VIRLGTLAVLTGAEFRCWQPNYLIHIGWLASRGTIFCSVDRSDVIWLAWLRENGFQISRVFLLQSTETVDQKYMVVVSVYSVQCWCRCLIACREDYRYNIEAVDLLISNQFVLMQQYDVHLAHSMENGMNYPAVVFAMQLVQRFCTDIDRLTVRAQEVCSVLLLSVICSFGRCMTVFS